MCCQAMGFLPCAKNCFHSPSAAPVAIVPPPRRRGLLCVLCLHSMEGKTLGPESFYLMDIATFEAKYRPETTLNPKFEIYLMLLA